MGGARGSSAAAGLAVALALAVAACSGGGDGGGSSGSGNGSGGLTVAVLSSRPEYVSAGDALVAVTVPQGADRSGVRVTAAGRDVTAELRPDPGDRRRLLGVVDGLPEGRSTIRAASGGDEARLPVVNHPATGPLFSGEQLPLYACTTRSFGLAASTPAEGCAAPTRVTWQYVDRAGERHPLADPTRPPADAATADSPGGKVPFVIRTETGTLDRAVYAISALDPHPDPSGRTVDASAWNRRLVYRYGGGCGVSYTQGFALLDPPADELLAKGYVTATSTFNTFQVLCNAVISAEATSMVKERVIETYGVPVHTIGEGGSGGAIQQLLVAQDYPGLLDAVAPTVPFPDALSISGGVYDCTLLDRYYATPTGARLSESQRAAIDGHATSRTCGLWDQTFARTINPTEGCLVDFSALGAPASVPFPTIPPERAYDAETNPDGYRCTVWESNVAITGRDPDTGFARPGYDNQGVTYGRHALQDGTITVDQFLDLNARIGGFDDDGNPVAARSAVPLSLVRRAYRTGQVTGGAGALRDTPIILVNVYTDKLGDIHDRVRSFSILDRLTGDRDTAPDTVSLWSIGLPEGDSLVDTLTGALGDFSVRPTLALDAWLTAAEKHRADRGGSWRAALAATKPAAAQSRCQPAGKAEIVGPDANDAAACRAAFPIHEEPRMAAGGPRRGDILKCALAPARRAPAAWRVDFTPAQVDRLAEIFPDGVCDYTAAGQGQAAFGHPWYDFGTGQPG
ncbi:MAG TPA: DUF6351 family protein [Acidimicrobiales bacterium]|nr:DUF6351 family protein [Acidimicrobiales bacterium]